MAVTFHDRDTATVTWVKYLLRGTIAIIAVIAVVWLWILHTESGAAFAWRQLESTMGGDLVADFSGGDFSSGFEILNLRFSTSTVDLSIESSRAAVDVDVFPLRIGVSNVEIEGVTVRSSQSDTEGETDLDVESLLAGLRLPLRLDVADVKVEKIEIVIDGSDPVSIDRVDTSFFWHDQINVRNLQVQMGDDGLTLRGGIHLVEPHSIDLGIEVIYQAMMLQGDVSGDPQSVELQNLVLEGDAIEANASATIHIIDGIQGSGNVNVSRLDPAGMTEAWPHSHPVAGSFGFEATPQFVRVSNGQLSIENSDTSMRLDGRFDLDAFTVSLNVGWSNVQWPVDSTSPSIESTDGSVTLDGALDNWQINGLIAVGTEEMPDGRFQVDGHGDMDHAALVIEEGKVFGGSVAGEAAYTWRDDQRWSANLEFDDVQTTGVVPDWPGVVSGKAEASGTQNPLAVNVMLQDIKGVIRGDVLTAKGTLAWSGNSATAKELSITHGNSRILLDGSANTAQGLAFGASAELESYVDRASGVIEASGRLSLLDDEPYLTLDMNSTGVQVGDVQISGIKLVDDRAEDEVASFVLNVDQIQAENQDIADIQLVASIRKDRQQVDLSGLVRGSDFGLSLEGAFDDWNSATESPWRGSVTSFSVDLNDEHSLHLQQATEVELLSTQIAVKQFCLADDVSSHLCVDFLRKSNGYIDLRAEFSSVPVAAVEHVVEIDASFDQRVSGVLNWVGDPESGATGKGDIQLSPGAITSSQQPSLKFQTGAGQLNFEITDGDLLSGTASIPLPGVGGIAANFRVVELTEVTTSKITGHLNVAMTDIAPLAVFSKTVDSLSGVLHTDLDLTGTFPDPLLTGSVVLDNGALSYQPIGLEVDNIELLAELSKDKSIELSGTFRAGEGRGEIDSSADYQDTTQPGIQFRIRGDELLLINVPDIQLTIKPDIEIGYSENLLNINGSLLIPTARVTPSNLAESKVVESDDVVIVAGQLPTSEDTETSESQIEFDGNVKIELGSDVIVDLNVARASLSGSAVFDWQGESLPNVEGRYDMVGNIQAFGQVLDITEGAIRFAKVPADQPYLRIRAEREIYGNSQVKTAGVLVDGVASHPTIEAYTNPRTTEERALTLLVTGSDFDYEQGIGAVDFGTYIAPRLFVSYGVGIFDRENIISARYDLSRGFGIKASSGDKESGVDLNYRFEN